ncbi:MAG TPA: P1 family peptidase, partial [Candidatus Limnocylindrales bacterium]|nr:P1 family peptidase [Candidatus Limnocylindrales bacterium]
KSGQGSATVHRGELVVAALVVVNAFGDIYDRRGNLLAGPRNPETGSMEKTVNLLLETERTGSPGNTTLGVVATNAALSREALFKVCQMAHNGLARCIWPVHTLWDGDTVFALSRGVVAADVSIVGLMAAEAVSHAVERAAITATSLGGVPALTDLKNM